MGNVKGFVPMPKKGRKRETYEARARGRADRLARNDQRRATTYGRARGNL